MELLRYIGPQFGKLFLDIFGCILIGCPSHGFLQFANVHTIQAALFYEAACFNNFLMKRLVVCAESTGVREQ